jgi:penicillin amidase
MHPDVIRLILTRHADWCDDRATPAVETCADQLAASLERALEQLRQRYGAEMEDWRWGRAHAAQFTNQIWANVPVLRALFATTIPANGGYDTIDRGATRLGAAAPYADVLGPSLRMIVDLGDIDGARFMISPGESGNVLSPHYRDLMKAWRNHAYLTLGGEPAGGTLVLAPP